MTHTNITTLAALKRHAASFTWAMRYNSWAKNGIREELYNPREVAMTDTVKIGFYTVKPTETTISYCDWPKARNVIIERREAGYKVTFKGETERDCTLEYFLEYK